MTTTPTVAALAAQAAQARERLREAEATLKAATASEKVTRQLAEGNVISFLLREGLPASFSVCPEAELGDGACASAIAHVQDEEEARVAIAHVYERKGVISSRLAGEVNDSYRAEEALRLTVVLPYTPTVLAQLAEAGLPLP